MSTRTIEEIVLDTMIELKAAERYFLETGARWSYLDPVHQRRLIEREREALGGD